MRITVNGQVAMISMQGSVSASLWNQAKERTKGQDREASELNSYINSVKSRLTGIHRKLEVDGKQISAQLIKDIYL